MSVSMNIAPQSLTVEGLVSAFYNSYQDEFGSGEPLKFSSADYAREIVARGDAMWNHPETIADAEDELSMQ